MNKKLLIAVLTGAGIAGTIATLIIRRSREQKTSTTVDLNRADLQQLLALRGIDRELAERVIENRPYRSKFELLERRIIPDDVFREIRLRLFTSVHLDDQSPSVLTSSGEQIA